MFELISTLGCAAAGAVAGAVKGASIGIAVGGEVYNLPGGNAIPDAWIAAAAHHHHLHLVTFDKGFRKLLKPSMVTVLKG